MCYVVGRSSLLPSLPQRSPCHLSGALGATCWDLCSAPRRPEPQPVLPASHGGISEGPARRVPRDPRVPAAPRTAAGRASEAALGALRPRWQRQAHGTLQLCLPVGDKGLALLPVNPPSPGLPSRKCHPPVSPCAAEAAPSFVTLLHWEPCQDELVPSAYGQSLLRPARD